MARVVNILNGPSKEKLLLALSDREMGVRHVKFSHPNYPGQVYSVEVTGLTRLDPHACEWNIIGTVSTGAGWMQVRIHYFTDGKRSRNGVITFVDWPGSSVKSSGDRKAAALMEAIFMMIAQYQEFHSQGDRCEEVFKTFEKAKRIHYSEDDPNVNGITLDEAIAGLHKR